MLTSHELFGFMSPVLANDILAFAHESDKPAYKATLAAVAQARHVRPVFLERQPRPQRHAAMMASLARPAIEALLAKQPPEAAAVYLNAFNEMNGAHWANLKTLPESDTRLQLGAH